MTTLRPSPLAALILLSYPSRGYAGQVDSTAVSELLYAEATGRSGLFLQENATLHDSGKGYIDSETALSRTALQRTREQQLFMGSRGAATGLYSLKSDAHSLDADAAGCLSINSRPMASCLP
jgi:hypothetical protein